jgi:hypothetical protein
MTAAATTAMPTCGPKAGSVPCADVYLFGCGSVRRWWAVLPIDRETMPHSKYARPRFQKATTSRARPQPLSHVMADSAAAPFSLSEPSLPSKRRSPAASSSDERQPRSTAIERQLQAARADATGSNDAAYLVDIDPRQGTLLGFELPADMIAAMANEREPAGANPAVPLEAGGPARGTSIVEQERTMAKTSSIGDQPAAIEQSSASATPPTLEAPFGLDQPDPNAIAMTLASLEDAFVEARLETAERWRRTQKWFAFALAGLALLLVVSVVQTVALIDFAHSVQTGQEEVQTALNQQQATLASLTSVVSAPPAGLRSTDGQVLAADQASAASAVPATDATPPHPTKHARRAHSRHSRETARARDRALFGGH